jgi:hypothetical protein
MISTATSTSSIWAGAFDADNAACGQEICCREGMTEFHRILPTVDLQKLEPVSEL